MRAIDVMTTQVILARPEMTVHEAAKMLVDHDISGMPVVDAEGRLAGMITEGDLLHRMEIGTQMKRRGRLSEFFTSTRELAREYVKENSPRLSEVMTADVVTAKEDTPLAEIAEMMDRHRIKHVPVVRDGKVVGLVSRANLIRVLASIGPDLHHSVAPSDAEVRQAILTELGGNRWALPSQNVIVTNGVAHLWGVIKSEEEREAIRVAAKNVPGVKDVICHLVYPSIPLY
ncbi:CBS domain-containing protein [Pandoraea terrigena]|uniref:Histidine kinase n=1 Tax=Pandoraea terrigena TaxID=2508292 RepID=A0A5E4RVP9_9BURK|nr:CBS domain-containing protein [Pandoraea terrigena]VVD67123.1 histidine kinase [Pandoraea terrigena]